MQMFELAGDEWRLDAAPSISAAGRARSADRAGYRLERLVAVRQPLRKRRRLATAVLRSDARDGSTSGRRRGAARAGANCERQHRKARAPMTGKSRFELRLDGRADRRAACNEVAQADDDAATRPRPPVRSTHDAGGARSLHSRRIQARRTVNVRLRRREQPVASRPGTQPCAHCPHCQAFSHITAVSVPQYGELVASRPSSRRGLSLRFVQRADFPQVSGQDVRRQPGGAREQLRRAGTRTREVQFHLSARGKSSALPRSAGCYSAGSSMRSRRCAAARRRPCSTIWARTAACGLRADRRGARWPKSIPRRSRR